MGILSYVDDVFLAVLRRMAKHNHDDQMLNILDRIRMRQLKEKFESVWEWVQEKYEELKDAFQGNLSTDEALSSVVFEGGIERYPEIFTQFQMAASSIDMSEFGSFEDGGDFGEAGEMELDGDVGDVGEIELDDDGGIIEDILDFFGDLFS